METKYYSRPWKNNIVSYQSIHRWIKRHWGQKQLCEFCKTEEGRIEWANKSGNYERYNRKDWFRLCVPCHRKFDSNKI